MKIFYSLIFMCFCFNAFADLYWLRCNVSEGSSLVTQPSFCSLPMSTPQSRDTTETLDPVFEYQYFHDGRGFIGATFVFGAGDTFAEAWNDAEQVSQTFCTSAHCSITSCHRISTQERKKLTGDCECGYYTKNRDCDEIQYSSNHASATFSNVSAFLDYYSDECRKEAKDISVIEKTFIHSCRIKTTN